MKFPCKRHASLTGHKQRPVYAHLVTHLVELISSSQAGRAAANDRHAAACADLYVHKVQEISINSRAYH